MASSSPSSSADLTPAIPTPLELFSRWFDEAVVAGLPEPEAMVLATATRDGQPSARVVLCRGISPQGLRFFTNRQSRKGGELEANPRAAAVFFWQPLGRQVRFEGDIEVLSAEEDDAYFAARPRGHQLAALASPQSHPIDGITLLNRFEELQLQFQGQPVPRPPHWGGYRLVPRVIEFWSRRDNRLHDRTVYHLSEGLWRPETLAP
jgi:pyridoxamine 5'-phosphate oxidase